MGERAAGVGRSGTASRRPVIRRFVASAPWSLAAISTSLAAALLVLARLNGETVPEMLTGQTAFSAAFGIVFPLVGAFLAWRLLRNPVGWLLIGIGTSQTVALFAGHYGQYARANPQVPSVPSIAMLGEIVWVAALPLLALLLLFYPHGRLPSRHWRWVARLVAAGVLLMAVAVALDWRSWTAAYVAGTEPPSGTLGQLLGGVAFATLVLTWFAALAGLIVRYRRSRGVERQQMRWFTYAAAVVLLSFLVSDLLGPAGAVVTLVAVFVLPGAIAVAVLRYRLFDIDRVISRTVSYALLTALLAGVYAAGVFGLSGLVRAFGAGGGDLVVAGSTLAVAAAFGPLRRRVQSLVDRRFNRSRFDAQRVVGSFAERLRDEIELDVFVRDLRGVVAATVAPSSASLWLAEQPAP